MTTAPSRRPILIAGPTGSGKSTLALRLAASLNGVIINADALQVYDCWRVLSARPDAHDLAAAPHKLYGHVGYDTPYSVGAWLREVAPLINGASQTSIIIGGTGLYFTALTEGLADIPPVTEDIRAQGNELREAQGALGFVEVLQVSDPETLLRIDQNNPMRLQRAWEVLQATGKGLAHWQDHQSPPLLPLEQCNHYVINVDVPVLDARIAARFDQMLEHGALDEARAAIARGWDASLPSSRAIGAAELVAALRGQCDMPDAVAAAKLASRQYAKRQRSWFRNRMGHWGQLKFTTLAERDAAFSLILHDNC